MHLISPREIEDILASVFKRRTSGEAAPTQEDWRILEHFFRCQFPDSFMSFYAVVGEFWFEGELLEVPSISNNSEEDTIVVAYEAEKRIGNWPPHLIPFYAVGNGDYECLSSKEGKCSAVYYVRHEDRSVHPTHHTFDDWVKKLPEDR